MHGCTVTSAGVSEVKDCALILPRALGKIEYCSELYQNTVYVHLHQAMKREFRPHQSCKF